MKKILPLIFLLSACSLAPDYERPVVDAPAWREGESAEATEIPAEWWKNFNSEELNSLVAESLASNTDLQAALQRIEQSRANVKIASAALYPSIDASVNLSRSQVDNSSTNNGGRNSYRAGLSVNYELDLFGRNRANSQSAEESLKGTQYDHDALALIVTSDTARTYAELLSTQDRVSIAEKNLKDAAEVMKIIQARFDEGATSGLEVAQEKTSLAGIEASIESLKTQADVLRNALAVLTGAPPQSFNIQAPVFNLETPQIAPGQPSELLERRPDIKTAEADLKAANIDIGAARAEYFPSLQIGLDSAFAASPLSAPTALTTGLVGSLLAPIFHGGAIEGGVEAAKARKEELVANYRGVILTAFREVEDALSSTKTTANRLQFLTTAATEAQKAYDIAKTRYKEGSSDYQTLLDTEQALFQAQDNFLQAKFAHVSAAIDLYKALGGGWKEE